MRSKGVAAGRETAGREIAEFGSAQSQPATGLTLEEIRQRAYELHLERGCMHGSDLDDWLQAERELKEKHQAG